MPTSRPSVFRSAPQKPKPWSAICAEIRSIIASPSARVRALASQAPTSG